MNLRISKIFVGLLILGLFKLSVVGLFSMDSLTKRMAETLADNGPELVRVALAANGDANTPAAAPPQNEQQQLDQDLAKAEENATQSPPEGVSEADWRALKIREEEILRREHELRTLEEEVNARLQRLQALEKNIRAMLDQADVLKDKKIKHLVDVYSNMKSKQAAQVIESLDIELAVKILSGMRGRQAGEILTFVSPEKAAKLSEALTKLQTPLTE